jgi:hypothetical protein
MGRQGALSVRAAAGSPDSIGTLPGPVDLKMGASGILAAAVRFAAPEAQRGVSTSELPIENNNRDPPK